MEDLLGRLKRGEVIVGDGALGTMLMQRGLKIGEPPESYNLSRPEVLEEIASQYLDAGAEIVTTNTFGASPLRLQQFSLDQDTEAINRAAVEAVRRAVGDKAYVSGDVGPSAKMLKPLGNAEPDEISASLRRQVRALLAAGIDIVCIETVMDLNEAVLAIKAARSLDSKIPIMATVTFGRTPQGYFTLMGCSVEDAVGALEGAGANIIGSNCGEGAAQMVEIAREFRRHAHAPVAIQSNAGLPVKAEAGLVYPETPDFVAAKASEMLDLGVQIVGGCCGTTPEHIRAIRKIVDDRRK
ncbi:MAG TPA: homocysteine S-methyltransferase family protein [Acidobacteriota bacterium]|nr:homocysteine S-methyltransferase family protein [Acidobacteriota bacterium]